MTTTAATTTEAEPAKIITIRLDVTYEVKGDIGILDAMEAAKELVAKAKEYGQVEGQVMFGRQKFPLR